MPRTVIPKTERAKRFKTYRKYKLLSQADMGKVLNKSQVMIGRYERGEKSIPDQVINDLHDKLGMSFEFYYEGKTPHDSKGGKTSMVTDVHQLTDTITKQGYRIDDLEKMVKKLYNDFYADKNKVS